ncbi:hypothetical protein Droror1_Dr00019428 [Drosera rotundifolia]
MSKCQNCRCQPELATILVRHKRIDHLKYSYLYLNQAIRNRKSVLSIAEDAYKVLLPTREYRTRFCKRSGDQKPCGCFSFAFDAQSNSLSGHAINYNQKTSSCIWATLLFNLQLLSLLSFNLTQASLLASQNPKGNESILKRELS